MRVTEKQLDSKVEYLNRITGNPLTRFREERDENNSLVSNVGHYYVEHVNGRVQLSRITNERGGAIDVSLLETKSQLNDVLRTVTKVVESVISDSLKRKGK